VTRVLDIEPHDFTEVCEFCGGPVTTLAFSAWVPGYPPLRNLRWAELCSAECRDAAQVKQELERKT